MTACVELIVEGYIAKVSNNIVMVNVAITVTHYSHSCTCVLQGLAEIYKEMKQGL